MTRRLLIATAILFFGHAWRTLVRPDLSDAEIASLATAQLRDDGRSLVALQTIHHAQHWREMILPFGAALTRINMKINQRSISFLAITTAGSLIVLAVAVMTVGRVVIRPYDVPEYQEIDTSDSAFLIPLEGDTSKQQIFPSVDFLNEQKIAAKRVQIGTRAPGSFPIWLPRALLRILMLMHAIHGIIMTNHGDFRAGENNTAHPHNKQRHC